MPLQLQLADLAAQFDTPVFLPHLTLLSGISIDSPIAQLEDQIRQAILEWNELPKGPDRCDGLDVEFSTGDERLGHHTGNVWEYLFLKVVASTALSELRSAVESQLGTSSKAFYPHLSLMYSSDEQYLDLAVATLTEEVSNRIAGFTSNEVVLMKCQGQVEDWTEVARFDLR